MKQLLIYILTYERTEVLKEILDYELDYLKKYGIDIHILDSSLTADTECMIRKYVGEGVHNLKYTRLPNNIKVEEKWIYGAKSKENSKYNYIWFMSDCYAVKNKLIEKILQIIALEKTEVIYLNRKDDANVGNCKITEYNYFYNIGWYATLLPTLIYKTEFLNTINLDHYLEKYGTWCCLGIVFEKFVKTDMSIYHLSIGFPELDFYGSQLKRVSWWRNGEAFLKIYCEDFINFVDKLPQCYENKDEFIRKNADGELTIDDLILLRKQKFLNYNIYLKYRKQWERVLRIPKRIVKMISILPL